MKNPSSSSWNIHQGLHESFSFATIKRILKKLHEEGFIVTDGKKRGASYSSPSIIFRILFVDLKFLVVALV